MAAVSAEENFIFIGGLLEQLNILGKTVRVIDALMIVGTDVPQQPEHE
jgi:hypothetical protein